MPKLNKDYPCRKEFRLSREMEKAIAWQAKIGEVSESQLIRDAVEGYLMLAPREHGSMAVAREVERIVTIGLNLRDERKAPSRPDDCPIYWQPPND